jgi:protein TonB
MRSASLSWSDVKDSRALRRATSLTLTVLAHLIILLILLRTTAFQFQPPGAEPRLVTMDVSPEPQLEAKRSSEKVKAKRAEASPPPPPRPTPPPPPVKPQIAQPWVLTPGLEQFDLRQVRSQPVERPAAAPGESQQADSGSVYGPTDTPGGGRLFNAEWYREPTDAELGYYMPRGVIGWGIIACQTVERFHVDNCREIADSPPGSGLARAVREASWQFLVRPPRINGKPMVGAWVRIRIDLTPNGSRAR